MPSLPESAGSEEQALPVVLAVCRYIRPPLSLAWDMHRREKQSCILVLLGHANDTCSDTWDIERPSDSTWVEIMALNCRRSVFYSRHYFSGVCWLYTILHNKVYSFKHNDMGAIKLAQN